MESRFGDVNRPTNASVYLHAGKLFAGTPNTLFALHPDSGETLWSFCPYGSDGESIYSSPSVNENRVYIGEVVFTAWTPRAAKQFGNEARTGRATTTSIPHRS